MQKSHYYPKLSWLLVASLLLLGSGCDTASKLLERLSKTEQPRQELSPSVAAQSSRMAEMEAAVYRQINAVRQAHHLQKLQSNARLIRVARAYSQQMARQNFFSHTSPAGDTVVKRVHVAHLSYWLVGENLFKSVNIPDPVSLSVQGWMNSPGHRRNILQPEFTETGIGIWRTGNTYYFTQVFLRQPPVPFSL